MGERGDFIGFTIMGIVGVIQLGFADHSHIEWFGQQIRQVILRVEVSRVAHRHQQSVTFVFNNQRSVPAGLNLR